jgi:hypothetical protein
VKRIEFDMEEEVWGRRTPALLFGDEGRGERARVWRFKERSQSGGRHTLLSHPFGWEWMAQDTLPACLEGVGYSIVKDLAANASNTLRRREIGAHLGGIFDDQPKLLQT